MFSGKNRVFQFAIFARERDRSDVWYRASLKEDRKVAEPPSDRRLLNRERRCSICDCLSCSLATTIRSFPRHFPLYPPLFQMRVVEPRHGWWGEIVNDASHGKSRSAGHATPFLAELLFNGALFMKLDVARPRIYLPMRGWARGERLTHRSWMIPPGDVASRSALSMRFRFD